MRAFLSDSLVEGSHILELEAMGLVGDSSGVEIAGDSSPGDGIADMDGVDCAEEGFDMVVRNWASPLGRGLRLTG